MRAGAQAVKVYALREALEHYEHAYEALRKLPNASPEQLCDAILGLGPGRIQAQGVWGSGGEAGGGGEDRA